ncbi:AarF/ABC1/UbiB kinase family protein [Nocardia yamanashiensis]|uniref:ABC1 kinase family protein n=1 Tax=Nocardia yamanashiensis TaxID=209247 RepID=UPI001E487A9B|nr:AarF/ABC1/UbiB kinase family protein [Nocardia yamanashiensis]UGT42443.1 AarF/ABC1/UbiB kinase family protein [Nocardia yamanashiensis]
MAGKRRTGLARSAKLAALPMGIMARRVTATGKAILTGAERGAVDEALIDKAAEEVFRVLGELKGGAMKLGQALSVAEAAVPPRFADRYRDALARLQNQAPPMPTHQAHRVLDEQLGTRWRDRFESFEDRPVAAASIGQVHRAVWKDGRVVAVKIQYPGADAALMSDLKLLQMLSSTFGVFLPGVNVKALIEEFVERTADELDYRIEAGHQRRFAAAFADDPRFFVPKVVASAPKVMVTEWMDATPLARVIAEGTAAQRNRAGALLAEFALSSPRLAGLMHCDPHPGNFQLLADGRLGVIDFGACIALPDGLPPVVGELARYAVEEDYDALLGCLRANGFVRPGHELDLDPIVNLVAPVIAEFDGDRLHLSRRLLQDNMARAMDVRNMSVNNTFAVRVPPELPDLVMLGRVLGGIVGVAAQLDAEIEILGLARCWLPGYLEEGEAA